MITHRHRNNKSYTCPDNCDRGKLPKDNSQLSDDITPIEVTKNIPGPSVRDEKPSHGDLFTELVKRTNNLTAGTELVCRLGLGEDQEALFNELLNTYGEAK